MNTISENIAISRWGFATEKKPLNSSERGNFILANEYLDFLEFLENEMSIQDFDDLRSRFFADSAQSNIEGWRKCGVEIPKSVTSNETVNPPTQ